MKVRRIKIENVKAIKSLDVDFKGCSVIVTAGNNVGKTTLLKSLPERLAGTKAKIRDGASEGYCEWELSSGDRFVWELEEGKDDKLRFITKDNIRTSVTREISNRFFPKQFDIDKFLTLSKNKQKEEIEKLSGIDTDELNVRYKTAYDDRTFVNRSLREAEALKIDFDPNIPEKKDEREEELRESISKVDVKNLQIETIEKGVAEKSSEIVSIKEEIAKLEARLGKLEEEVEKGNEWLKKNKTLSKKDLEEELEKVVASNKKVEDNNKKRENYKLVLEKRKEAEEADKKVKDIVAERHELIAQSKMPEGFSFDEEGDLLYNGFPFDKDHLSSSAIYIAALKLASLSLGEVRAIHFDASFLDKISLGEIQEWAETQDLQLLIERPDYSGNKEITYEFVS